MGSSAARPPVERVVRLAARLTAATARGRLARHTAHIRRVGAFTSVHASHSQPPAAVDTAPLLLSPAWPLVRRECATGRATATLTIAARRAFCTCRGFGGGEGVCNAMAVKSADRRSTDCRVRAIVAFASESESGQPSSPSSWASSLGRAVSAFIERIKVGAGVFSEAAVCRARAALAVRDSSSSSDRDLLFFLLGLAVTFSFSSFPLAPRKEEAATRLETVGCVVLPPRTVRRGGILEYSFAC